MAAQALPSVALLEAQQLMRDSLSRSLQAAGARVVFSTGDPAAFVTRVAARPPGVALLEVVGAPGSPAEGEGLGVLRLLRERAPRTRAVVLSSRTDPGLVELTYRQGAAGFLYKLTADVGAVVAALRAVDRGERIFPLELLPRVLVPGPAAASPLARLTARERQTLSEVSAGHDNLKIAALLGISERTVKSHIAALYRKLEAENRVQLALLARSLGGGSGG